MPLLDISKRIAKAESEAGRPPGAVELIAVSKVQPEDRVTAVLDEGHRIYGENRVQEAEGRWGALLPRYEGVELHLIGPLQSNKTRAAMALFQSIHTLDRLKLARAIARIADETGACPQLFVQVNTGDESQKAGVSVTDAAALLAECRTLSLPVVGLMCIPPVDEDPVPHFRLLRAMAQDNGLAGLSMGMSADFEAAIAEGATHIRVGSAIFGARVPPATP
ncbi:MAG: YggS family pyridoxal phosphate-dependent enzyme [Pseudomonadota bacterium]